MAQTVKNLPAKQKTCVRSLGREDPLEEGMATHCGGKIKKDEAKLKVVENGADI